MFDECFCLLELQSQHLTYARAAYEKALEDPEIAEEANTWLEYSKVLMHLGEADLGIKTITTMLRKFQGDGNSALYHLTAGAILSSVGKYEQAGHYFFETIQMGLPKFFNKSDLMFILSRSFEQLGYETRTDSSGPVEDGYVMVFTHMLSETGSELESATASAESLKADKELLYDDWISNFETWRNVGDKCAMHGLFNLAADLYGQGLVRDSKAFSKASLWFRFAKSCFRCARTSDAQLAVKQAVTLDPNNSQCNVALNTWSKYSNDLMSVIEEGPLSDILKLIPAEKSLDLLAAMKIQAIFRGERLRVLFNSKLTYETSTELFARMNPSLDMTIRGYKTKQLYNFSVEVHWKGNVRHIDFINKDSQHKGRLKLNTPFNVPLYFVKLENSYDLVIENLTEFSEEKEKEYDQIDAMPIDYYKPIEHEIAVSFIEKETDIYHRRIFYVSLTDKDVLQLIERSDEVFNNIPVPEPVHESDVLQRSSILTEESQYMPQVIAESTVELPPPTPESKSVSNKSMSSKSMSHKSLSSKTASTAPPLTKGSDMESVSLTHASVVQDSVSGMSWNENDDASTVAESIHSLFKPYRSRKGCYSYYGNNFLYSASVVSSIMPSVTSKVVPSAQAISRGPNSENRNKGYLRVDILNGASEMRYMFLLPLNLSALNSIHDIVPLLLLVLDEIPSNDLATARAASMNKSPSHSIQFNLEELVSALTPRRHGLRVFGGKLQLLAEISPGVSGEVIIALNEESNIRKLQQHQLQKAKQQQQHNAANVLQIHQSKMEAWLFLQDQVNFALDCDNGSSSYLGQSIESSTIAEPVQSSGSGMLVDKSLYSKDSFVNDLERSLHNKHKQNIDGDSDDNVSVLTFTDEYEEARKKAEAQAKAQADEEARAKARAEAERKRLVEEALRRRQEEEERKRQKEEDERKKKEEEERKKKEQEEDAEEIEARRLAEELARIQAENMAKLKEAQLAAQLAAEEEERRRKEEEEANEEARRSEEEIMLAELGANRVIEISESDLVPIEVLPENEINDNGQIKSYKSVVLDDDLDESQIAMDIVEDSNNIQSAFFLAFQAQRIDTLEYLKHCGEVAKTRWIRKEAFECLRRRAQEAIANPVTPPPRRKKSRKRSLENSIERSSSLDDKEKVVNISAEVPKPPEPPEPQPSVSFATQDESEGRDEDTSFKSRSTGRASKASSRGKLTLQSPHASPMSSTSPRTSTGERYTFNNQNKASRESSSVFSPTPTSEEVLKEELWQSQMESKLEQLLEQQLTSEEFTSNPDDLVRVLHEFDEDFADRGAIRVDRDAKVETKLPPLTKQRSRRSSIIVQLPPEKIEAWENSMAHITLSNKLQSVGKGHPNPVFFLDKSAREDAIRADSARRSANETPSDRTRIRTAESAVTEDDYPLEVMFDDSIMSYHHKGYSTGTCAYLAIWKTKIRRCVRSYETLGALNKAIIQLRKGYTEQISKAGALCSLAHAHGSVGEALGQLFDKTFKQEVLLVCQALPVNEVILRIEKSVREDKNKNEFANETIEYDMKTNKKLVFRPDSFPLQDETPYIKDLHSPYSTPVSRSSPHFGLTAMDESVRIRSKKMPVIVTPKDMERSNRFGVTEECKIDTVTGFPLIVTSPCPSPVPQDKKPMLLNKSKNKKKKSSASSGSDNSNSGRYIRLNDAIDMMARETESFTIMSQLEAARAREEQLLLKYHPQDNSYYRSSKQKKIIRHKQKKKERMTRQNTGDSFFGNETDQLSVNVD